jgi:hypothetical protein
VRDNQAPEFPGFTSSGGGLHLTGRPATLTNCLIADNTTAGPGGGVYAVYTTVTLAGTTTIQGNTADRGGGICSNFEILTTLTIGPDCRITGNTASADGGGGIDRAGRGEVILQGADPSPIVTDNCPDNCGGGTISKCAATPVSCPAP